MLPAPRTSPNAEEALAQEGLLTAEQWAACLDLHGRIRALGLDIRAADIAVQKGWLASADLEAFRARHRLVPDDGRPPLPPEEKLPLGQIALQNRLVTEVQVAEALDLQARVRDLGVRKPIGEILIERGHLDPKVLQSLLVIQNRNAPAPAAVPEEIDGLDDDGRLGVLAARNHLITQAQLDEALFIQKKCRELGTPLRIGEILVLRGWCTRKVIESLCELQGIRREAIMQKMEVEIARKLETGQIRDLLAARGLPTEVVTEAKRVQAELSRLGIEMAVGEILLGRGAIPRDLLHEIMVRGKAPPPLPARGGKGWVAALLLAAMGVAVLFARGREDVRPAPVDPQAQATERTAQSAPRPRRTGLEPQPAGVPAGERQGEAQAPVRPVADAAPDADREALLSRARSHLPWNPESLLEVVGIPGMAEGRVSFLILGYANLPDGANIQVAMEFDGNSVPGVATIATVRQRYFALRAGPFVEDQVILHGTYTIEARFLRNLQGSLEETAALDPSVPESLVRRYSFQYGYPQYSEDAEAEQIRDLLGLYWAAAGEAREAMRLIEAIRSRGKAVDEQALAAAWAEGTSVLDRVQSAEGALVERERRILARRFTVLSDAARMAIFRVQRLARAALAEMSRAAGQTPPAEIEEPGHAVPLADARGSADAAIVALERLLKQFDGVRPGDDARALMRATIGEARGMAAELREVLRCAARAEAGATEGAGVDAFVAWAQRWDAQVSEIEGRDPGLVSGILTARSVGFDGDFAKNVARLRDAGRSGIRQSIVARKGRPPAPFADAPVVPLDSALEAVELGWKDLEGRIR